MLTLTTSKEIRARNKQKYVDYLGGACIICGYNKCIAALDFHHIDPKQKKFTLSDAYYQRVRDWDILQRELDKCALLCSNCHEELHYGVVELPVRGSTAS